jgi:hypothetical protein
MAKVKKPSVNAACSFVNATYSRRYREWDTHIALAQLVNRDVDATVGWCPFPF